MLTGKPPFLGETTAETLAAIIRAEPDFSLLPAATPTRIRELLTRCLQKDSKMRLRDIGDARIELTNVIGAPAEKLKLNGVSKAGRGRNILFALAGLAIGVIATVLTVWRVSGLSPRRVTTQPVKRFAVNLPESEPLALT